MSTALALYGVDDSVSINSPFQFSGTKYSICGWFRAARDFSGYIVGNSDTNDIRINNGILEFVVWTGSEQKYLSSVQRIDDNQWHFFVGTRNDTTLEFYIDNVLTSSITLSTNPTYSNKIVAIGRRGNSADYFKGAVNGIKLYNIAIDSTKRTLLYNSGNFVPSATDTNLVASYNLIETTGLTVADSSGNNKNGTISGTTVGIRWLEDRDRLTPITWYASNSGSFTNDGSINAPWDIKTIFRNPPSIIPGDTIILLDGIYNLTEKLTSYLTGTSSKRINVKTNSSIGTFPNTVKLDSDNITSSGASLSIYGAYTTYNDLEIFNSNPQRVSIEAGSSPTDIIFNSGLSLKGKELIINYPHIHDCNSDGIGCFDPAGNITVNFPLIYNNGWTGPDRTHGHGIYTHNNIITNILTWNGVVSFNPYSYAFHQYTSRYEFDSYNQHINGLFSSNGSLGLIGASPKHNFSVLNVNAYKSPLVLGYGDEDNYDMIMDDVYSVGARMTPRSWRNFTLTNSTVVSDATAMMVISKTVGNVFGSNTFSNNTYWNGVSPNIPQSFVTYLQSGTLHSYYNFSGWKALGYDTNSTYHFGTGDSEPTINVVRYNADTLTLGRGLVAIWNWQNLASVNINLSNTGLITGQLYKIFDCHNPTVQITTGIYNSSNPNVSIPMVSNGVAQRINDASSTPSSTMPFYGMLLVVPYEGSGGNINELLLHYLGNTPPPTD